MRTAARRRRHWTAPASEVELGCRPKLSAARSPRSSPSRLASLVATAVSAGPAVGRRHRHRLPAHQRQQDRRRDRRDGPADGHQLVRHGDRQQDLPRAVGRATRGGAQLDTMARWATTPPGAVLQRRAQAGATANGINDYVNPDLVGLSPLQIMDKVVDVRRQQGHAGHPRPAPADRGRADRALVQPTVPEARWINDWMMLAQRYADNPTVIGADLHNEPHAEGTNPAAPAPAGAAATPTRDWRLAAERAGNAILGVQPELADLRRGRELPERRPLQRLGQRHQQRRGLRLVGRQPVQGRPVPVRLNVANGWSTRPTTTPPRSTARPGSTPRTTRPTCRRSGTSTGATCTSRTSRRS